MHAVVRVNSFDETKQAQVEDNLREFDELHAAQPGFLGSITVDLGGGRRFVLNVWRSRRDAEAGLSVLGPEVARLLAPLMSAPSELIGSGEILNSDFVLSPDEPHEGGLE